MLESHRGAPLWAGVIAGGLTRKRGHQDGVPRTPGSLPNPPVPQLPSVQELKGEAEQPEADRHDEAMAGVAIVRVMQNLAHHALRAVLGQPEPPVEDQPDLGPPVRPEARLVR
jgi:hypothetical protein